jgi:uncharacterized membrane protein
VSPARFRDMVSRVLVFGVLASAACIAVGFGGALAVGWDGSFGGAPTSGLAATDFSGVPAGLVALRPIAFTQAGLLVLLATPVLRIAASFAGFALEGDRLYASITLAVLAILLISLFGIR